VLNAPDECERLLVQCKSKEEWGGVYTVGAMRALSSAAASILFRSSDLGLNFGKSICPFLKVHDETESFTFLVPQSSDDLRMAEVSPDDLPTNVSLMKAERKRKSYTTITSFSRFSGTFEAGYNSRVFIASLPGLILSRLPAEGGQLDIKVLISFCTQCMMCKYYTLYTVQIHA